MRKIIGIMVVLSSILLSGSASARVQYVYLGGALNAHHCAQIAGSYGYRFATFGGYINGIYYWNACFGSDYMYPHPNPDTEPSRRDIEEAVMSLRLSTLLLSSTLLNSDEYSELTPFVQAYRDELDYLNRAVEDRASLLVIRRRFDRVSAAFSDVEEKYIEIFREASDRDVERAWDELEQSYVELASLLR